MDNKELGELLLVNHIIQPDICPFPDCGSEDIEMDFFPSEEEKFEPDLLHMKCKCDNNHEWLEVYRFVAVKQGPPWGAKHIEAWTDNIERIYISIVNQELLAMCIDMLRYVEAGPIQTKSDRQFLVNRLKELIDNAKGVEKKYAQKSE